MRSEGTDGATNKKIIEALGDYSKNSLALLDNLLKWSNVQTGKINYQLQEIDLVRIATDQIKVQKYTADSKEIRIDLEFIYCPKLRGDKNRIANVIRNLISNAIKYSHEGGVVVVEITKKDNEVSLSVEDSGVGIPEAYLNKLFDVTEVTIQLGTSKEKGSGLGLVLCKQFVEMHGGRLEIESHPSKGTIASFTIPLDI